ncbi:NAD-dependent epimerase/dehydratase family protein [Duganella sp. CT11-25]|jgi:uncharacterized protein YbjT (DUF2867 family)|uniref:NAD-dependent epimerase/dehydratase family protein n=1 Tax=unclassified Duganella TaxID=2636909 RepID=UPI0039AF94B0
MKKIKVILTGATGYVGEGVLLECLAHPAVEEVLVLTRRPCGVTHPKIRECIVPDFLDLERHGARLSGYDACFYCAGMGSAGVSEEAYARVTRDMTVHVAATLAAQNPQLVFCHVSGRAAEARQRKHMWARVKWQTENALAALRLPGLYNIRAGIMKPTPGQRNVNAAYRVLSPLYPLLRRWLPTQVSTMGEVGLAMINVVLKGHSSSILEVADIRALAAA